jgi:hypothetical protein
MIARSAFSMSITRDLNTTSNARCLFRNSVIDPTWLLLLSTAGAGARWATALTAHATSTITAQHVALNSV